MVSWLGIVTVPADLPVMVTHFSCSCYIFYFSHWPLSSNMCRVFRWSSWNVSPAWGWKRTRRSPAKRQASDTLRRPATRSARRAPCCTITPMNTCWSSLNRCWWERRCTFVRVAFTCWSFLKSTDLWSPHFLLFPSFLLSSFRWTWTWMGRSRSL